MLPESKYAAKKEALAALSLTKANNEKPQDQVENNSVKKQKLIRK
jgi:hypothetical protein